MMNTRQNRLMAVGVINFFRAVQTYTKFKYYLLFLWEYILNTLSPLFSMDTSNLRQTRHARTKNPSQM